MEDESEKKNDDDTEEVDEQIMDWNNESVEVEEDPLNQAMAINEEFEYQFSLDYSTEYIY